MRNHRNIPSYNPPHLEQGIAGANTQSTPQEHHRLTPQAYRQLEQQLEGAQVTGATTDIHAGFKLGIQHTLKILRDGFTIGA